MAGDVEDVAGPDGAVIARAIAAMRDHLTEGISVPAIAAAAGVSVRGLQTIFQRRLHVSPLLFHRRLRLQAARALLVSYARDTVSIAEVAHRFGYANAGRFTAHYRHEYGETPSSTLNRIRARRARATSRADRMAAEIHRALSRLRDGSTRPT